MRKTQKNEAKQKTKLKTKTKNKYFQSVKDKEDVSKSKCFCKVIKPFNSDKNLTSNKITRNETNKLIKN